MMMLALAVAELSSDFFYNGGHHRDGIATIPSIIYVGYIIVLSCNPSLCVSLFTALLNLDAFVTQKSSGVFALLLPFIRFMCPFGWSII